MRKIVIILSFIIANSFVYAQSLRIGLIADCQYCSCDFSEKWNNNYSDSPARLTAAVDTLNTIPTHITFHLGDFIDRDFTSFKVINPIYNSLSMPHYHLLGNHDFSVEDSLKSSVMDQLSLAKPYYVVSKNNWKFIVLDGTDVSVYNTTDKQKIQKADSLRKVYLNEGRAQAKPWNGAISTTQLAWLDQELELADQANKNVIVLCHFPVFPSGDANLWNDVEVMTVLERHKSVKAFINGHHHPGNYAFQNGIHYLTLKGMVRSKKLNSFADIELKSDRIIVTGYGREESRILIF